jgi:hypothetical protein
MIKLFKTIGLFVWILHLSACQQHAFLTRQYTKGMFIARSQKNTVPATDAERIGTSRGQVKEQSTPKTSHSITQTIVDAQLSLPTAVKDADTLFTINGKKYVGRVIQINPFSVLIDDRNMKKQQIEMDKLNYIVYNNNVVEYAAELKDSENFSQGGWLKTLVHPDSNLDLYRLLGGIGAFWFLLGALISFIGGLIISSQGIVLLGLLLLILFVLGLAGMKRRAKPLCRFVASLFYLLGSFSILVLLLSIIAVTL